MNILSLYGLFLAKTLTLVVSISAIAIIITNLTKRNNAPTGKLKLTRLDESYTEIQNNMCLAKMTSAQKKIWKKEFNKKKQKEEKINKKQNRLQQNLKIHKPTLYVLDFQGSLDAREVSSLRKEISAVLSVAKKGDEVLLRLESPGGLVHGYGLAAFQLQRLRNQSIPLTISVDKIATSGGYMMASVASHIIAAPFSLIGSIGVVAQIPNFNRLLKRNEIDIELHTAGKYKRTLTLFGENSEEGREKFRDDLNQTYLLFKQFVGEMRPKLNIETVSTGAHWYGSQALEQGLIDEIGTSDDFIINKMATHQILSVCYIRHQKVIDRLINKFSYSVKNLLKFLII
ncbi:Probable protease SohB [Candidatus Erwinia haradaeae]|uniref:Probable protease SohB n=1 Tax=Candidatus Erwinia haradaeae TaxID=1922217 RepID=A0A451CZ76_9GAMM|nr:protease SohB [Candidatus Erwinia haradaeae]VFP78659.1 Probable protease SohB [Candidatus Erwinia haradaeae]